jgi:hypothetical protein
VTAATIVDTIAVEAAGVVAVIKDVRDLEAFDAVTVVVIDKAVELVEVIEAVEVVMVVEVLVDATATGVNELAEFVTASIAVAADIPIANVVTLDGIAVSSGVVFLALIKVASSALVNEVGALRVTANTDESACEVVIGFANLGTATRARFVIWCCCFDALFCELYSELAAVAAVEAAVEVASM